MANIILPQDGVPIALIATFLTAPQLNSPAVVLKLVSPSPKIVPRLIDSFEVGYVPPGNERLPSCHIVQQPAHGHDGPKLV